MKAKTRMFGEIDIQEDKIITLESGMIGFPDPQTAFPVINPVTIKEDYNPSVSEELLKPLGDMKQEDTFVLTTVRVPKDIQDMSINLKAPIIINMSNNRGAQIIVEDDLPVRYKIYDLLKSRKEKAGE